jgi:hypothetical protein
MITFAEGNVGGQANLLAWLRLWNLGTQTQTISVTMIADDGRLPLGQKPRTRTRTFDVEPDAPLTVSVHSEMWPGETANFSTKVECQDVCDAGMIGRPLADLWNPNALAVIPSRAFCM